MSPGGSVSMIEIRKCGIDGIGAHPSRVDVDSGGCPIYAIVPCSVDRKRKGGGVCGGVV